MNRSVPKEAVAAGILCEFLSFFPLSSSPRFSLTATTTVGLAHIRAGYPTLDVGVIDTIHGCPIAAATPSCLSQSCFPDTCLNS